MFHQHTKRVIRYIWCGSRPTFLLANRGFPSPCPSTYYFVGCNRYLIRFSYSSCSKSTNHSTFFLHFLLLLFFWDYLLSSSFCAFLCFSEWKTLEFFLPVILYRNINLSSRNFYLVRALCFLFSLCCACLFSGLISDLFWVNRLRLCVECWCLLVFWICCALTVALLVCRFWCNLVLKDVFKEEKCFICPS